ncbi:hypothetical protein PRUPE_1G204200 [Prunus persica]|uniref:Uncharacterized protein n=1 Tax=Prunus persica TaxID=3760 RepID=M5W7I1_PRUPE|nr:hypothetical protein PRUPE_1G204200 [Prunus persica]
MRSYGLAISGSDSCFYIPTTHKPISFSILRLLACFHEFSLDLSILLQQIHGSKMWRRRGGRSSAPKPVLAEHNEIVHGSPRRRSQARGPLSRRSAAGPPSSPPQLHGDGETPCT